MILATNRSLAQVLSWLPQNVYDYRSKIIYQEELTFHPVFQGRYQVDVFSDKNWSSFISESVHRIGLKPVAYQSREYPAISKGDVILLFGDERRVIIVEILEAIRKPAQGYFPQP